MINIIVAAANNLVIGKNNDIPWKLPTDMKHFKDITRGHKVIMGRKCWESIPEKFRPLPKRKNYVLTRDKDYIAKGATVIHDLHAVIEKYGSSREKIFIIGGSELYKEVFEYADTLYFTNIFNEVEGDTVLTGLDFKQWLLTDMSELIVENGLSFRFEVYKNKKLIKVANNKMI